MAVSTARIAPRAFPSRARSPETDANAYDGYGDALSIAGRRHSHASH